MRIPRTRTALVLFGVAAAALACATGPRDRAGVGAAHAEELFLQHCAVCHGARGGGDGPAAPMLVPPARRFGPGGFRLVSTENGVPTDEDLVATLRRGMPGSSMPSFGWMADADLAALARHVRVLAVAGLAHELEANAREEGFELEAGESDRIARERLTPGASIACAAAVRDARALARGRDVYLARCAPCHGEDARGSRTALADVDGTPNFARDLTSGFVKGGASPAALTARVRAGLPGSAMPPSRLEPADESAVVAYLRTLIPPGSEDRLVQSRGRLEAVRVEELPADLDAKSWNAAHPIRVALAPLAWHDDAVLAAEIAALHDGREVVVRIAWDDATGELHPFPDAAASDAAAVQFSDAREPALFGMGSAHEPTTVWHWRAVRVEDRAGVLDLLDPPAETRALGRADVTPRRLLLSRLEPSDRADRLVVRGVDTAAGAARDPAPLRADARWQNGRWTVTFRRSLRPDVRGEIALAPGSVVQIAAAVWNGAAGDAGARKSISIWQELVLAP